MNSSSKHDSAPRRVLIVYDSDSTQLAAIEIAKGLRKGLNIPHPATFEVYTEFLDSQRFPGPEHLDRAGARIAEKYAGRELDAVAAIGPSAFQFLLQRRKAIAPGAPMFFGAVTRNSLDRQPLPHDARGITSVFDVRMATALARRLQPDAREIVIVYGSSPFDKWWGETARKALGDSHDGFNINYLTDLSMSGFADALKRLPPSAAVVMLSIYQDAAGHKFVPTEAAAILAPVSGAPIYSVYDTFIGVGAVGGNVATFEDLGEQLATVIFAQLSGDPPPPQFTSQVTRPVVDWRVLQRFGLDPSRLSPDTEIRFRAPSLWDVHRGTIIATVAIILVQSATITALVLQNRRRKAAEDELATGRVELAHLSRASLLGELSGAFAHELNQPLTSILANTQVARQMIADGDANSADLQEILSDIEADDRRAASVIKELRRLLTKGDTVLEPADLNQIAAATVDLVRGELLSKQIGIELRRARGPVWVLANFSQLQQVVLNLVINAADAVRHLPVSERMIEVVVRKHIDRGDVIVSDAGPGVTTEMMEEVFKPFVSTKPKGLGLGLSICRSIAKAHGGSLRFDGEYLKGARVILSLPLEGEVHEERRVLGLSGG